MKAKSNVDKYQITPGHSRKMLRMESKQLNRSDVVNKPAEQGFLRRCMKSLHPQKDKMLRPTTDKAIRLDREKGVEHDDSNA